LYVDAVLTDDGDPGHAHVVPHEGVTLVDEGFV